LSEHIPEGSIQSRDPALVRSRLIVRSSFDARDQRQIVVIKLDTNRPGQFGCFGERAKAVLESRL
jgi:hypothetical protein